MEAHIFSLDETTFLSANAVKMAAMDDMYLDDKNDNVCYRCHERRTWRGTVQKRKK